ncbi:hypothetical protein [Laspinema olomoucense]|uniref:hypothetical protein n=1 Tax=Laspinema olomoucense TaxID=3231600 RepID=UPI0021BA43AC|nr:hypothetical protein [Laspinema sp. D3c]MCT7993607.1 hypothetical protein [Laspinema sp. D3c]
MRWKPQQVVTTKFLILPILPILPIPPILPILPILPIPPILPILPIPPSPHPPILSAPKNSPQWVDRPLSAVLRED